KETSGALVWLVWAQVGEAKRAHANYSQLQIQFASNRDDVFLTQDPTNGSLAFPGQPRARGNAICRNAKPRRVAGFRVRRRALDVEGFQRREAVEFDGAVAGGVGTGGQPVEAVADGQVQRQAVLVLLVHDVGAVAGRAGDHHFLHLALLLGPDGELDGLVHGFDQAGELAHVGVDPALHGGARFTRDQHHFAD